MAKNAQSETPKLSAGAKTAARIQQAAVDLVLENGVDSTTVEAICKLAGVSERTFFYHFPTKESAIMGIDLPKIDEQKAREFLAAPPGDIFSDALALIPFEPNSELDPTLIFKRVQMVQRHPELFSRHVAKLLSVREEHMELIYLRLRRNSPKEMPDAEVRAAAEFISEIAASYIRTEMERRIKSGKAAGPMKFTEVGATIARWVEVGRNA